MRLKQNSAADYIGLPWAWRGPVEKRDDSGNTWWEIRIEELPDFLVAEESPEEARAVVAEALEAFIDSYLSRGEALPDPNRSGAKGRFDPVAA